MQLSAIIRDDTQQEFSCEIRDFCIGGMYLVRLGQTPAHQHAQNEHITISCMIPTASIQRQLLFPARIVRNEGRSFGVAFINPELDALQALQDYARQNSPAPAQQSPIGANGQHAESDSTAQPVLYNGCRELLEGAIAPLTQVFIEHCTEHLFNTVKQLKHAQEQNAYFSALGIFEEQGDIFAQVFAEDISTQLQQRKGVDRPAESAPKETKLTQNHLTLIEDEVFEDWLAVTDLIDHAESRNAAALNVLTQRLAIALGRSGNHENNPFAPSLFAHAFQEALKILALEKVTLSVCYSVFRQVLADQLSALYEQLNQYLIDHNILPEMEFFAPPVSGEAPQSPTETSPCPAATPAFQATDSRQSPAFPEPASQSDTIATIPATTDVVPQNKNLYQVVQDLQSLQQHINNGRSDVSNPSATPAMAQSSTTQQNLTTTEPPPAIHYATEDILHALSNLQHEASSSTGMAQAHNYKERLMPLLAARQNDDTVRQIGIREQNIMDVSGNIFGSLLQDMLIANNVRNWLKKLEIPMLKLALQDDSLFLDKGHVARQVVNKISQLELYGDDDRHSGKNAIHQKIHRLLDRIAGEEHIQADVFSKALKELDVLIQTQNDAYQANLGDLTQACEQEQNVLESAHGSSEQPAPELISTLKYLTTEDNNCLREALAEPGKDDWQQWLTRVHRLKTGAWLLFSNESMDSQRLRLAWITKKQDRYVFVNLRGLREITLSDQELALRLRTGTAGLLDNADEPALDRAQYTMLQNMHQQLLYETTHDPLTGLSNRHNFEQVLSELFHQRNMSEQPSTLCYLDIEQFGLINDACGFAAGDRLLVEIAELLSKHLGGKVRLARLSGDDFGILFHDSNISGSHQQMQVLLGGMADFRFQFGDTHYPITLNIGLVALDTNDSSAAELLQNAKNSCRLAKEKGNNYIHLYHSDDQAVSLQKQSVYWRNRVDTDLANDALTLRCQAIAPITDTGFGPPHHSEILLGVNDEAGNPVSPEAFILAAERYKRMPAIDRWVIRHAFRWIVTHADNLDSLGGFAINLSGNSLNDEDFKAFILEEIRETGVPTERICFEVTETAGIDNLSSAASFILAIKETGCSFSLDDFGSGMSSYGYLKNLPVDFLKIDGAFVKELDKNSEDYAVVKSISEIGHFMGKKIIAEYVESAAILAQLRDIGVDYAQGYFIGKPQPLTELLKPHSV